MTDEIDPTLERAAEAVADQSDAEWPGGDAPGALGTTLERLRQLDRLARAHREARDQAVRDLPPGMAAGTEAFSWGPLRVRERLGSGSFGDVYRAFDPALSREVALKLRRPEEDAGTRRWLEEARHLARVRHPNVVTVHGAAEHDGRAGLWTELLRGETLAARLERDGPVGAREAAVIGIELCGALAAVHRAGIVHGDVTAANVMRESGASEAPGAAPGRVVLMDFGAGRERGQQAGSGTPLAVAPELLEGAPTSPASDVYSLGALLFRLLTGRYPIEATSLPELRAAFARGDRARLRDLRPDLPADLVAAIERALEPDPARRFANAGAMEAALASAIGAAPPRAVRPGWSLPRLTLVAAAIAAIVSAGLWARSRGAKPTAPSAVATPGAAAASAPLAVDATLLRRGETGSEPLADGARLGLGDRLALEVRSGEPVWAYVFNRDAGGHTYALFPLAGLETTNPLSPSQLHRLPGRLRGQPFAWQVTSSGGDESFVIVASRHPIPEMESLLASLESASPDRAPTTESAPEPTRGVGGMAPDPTPASPASNRLPELIDALARSGDRSVWLRTVHVSNPAR